MMQRTHWSGLGVVLSLAWIVAAPTARAQAPARTPSPIYLVLPTTRNDEHLDELAEIATAIDRALGQRGDKIPFAGAAEAFTQRHSREPQPVSPSDIELLYKESRFILQAVAERRHHDALEHMRVLEHALDSALETVNRNAEHARTYFRACVAQVRALVTSRNLVDAKQAAGKCRTDFPDLRPEPSETPPPVMEVFDQVERERAHGQGMLYVDSDRKCKVYLQGQPQTDTPFQTSGTIGEEYRVQVECGATPGRVYTRVLSDKPTHVFVDTSIDDAIRTSGGILRLVYQQLNPAVVPAHALELAKPLQASSVITVSMPHTGMVLLQRVNRDKGPVFAGEAITLPVSYTDHDIKRALDTLLAEPSATRASDAAAGSETDRSAGAFPTVHESAPRAPRWLLPTGISLAALGVGSFALAAWRFQNLKNEGLDLQRTATLDPALFRDDIDRWGDARRAPLAWAAAGSALGSVGSGMLAVRTPTSVRRWLAPVLGALGGGLAAAGVVQIARGDACDPSATEQLRRCLDTQERRDGGALLTLAALPLLTAPVVMLATRRAKKPSTTEASLSTWLASSSVHVLYRF